MIKYLSTQCLNWRMLQIQVLDLTIGSIWLAWREGMPGVYLRAEFCLRPKFGVFDRLSRAILVCDWLVLCRKVGFRVWKYKLWVGIPRAEVGVNYDSYHESYESSLRKVEFYLSRSAWNCCWRGWFSRLRRRCFPTRRRARRRLKFLMLIQIRRDGSFSDWSSGYLIGTSGLWTLLCI